MSELPEMIHKDELTVELRRCASIHDYRYIQLTSNHYYAINKQFMNDLVGIIYEFKISPGKSYVHELYYMINVIIAIISIRFTPKIPFSYFLYTMRFITKQFQICGCDTDDNFIRTKIMTDIDYLQYTNENKPYYIALEIIIYSTPLFRINNHMKNLILTDSELYDLRKIYNSNNNYHINDWIQFIVTNLTIDNIGTNCIHKLCQNCISR
jgi:hypothetical protein